MKLLKYSWFYYALFALFIATVLFELVFHPGEIMITKDGDGIKNIYTYLYHVLYGGGLWFEGGNYPFGEHVTYTDNQPLLALSMVYIKNHFGMSREFALTVFHLVIPISFFLGCVFTFKILDNFNLPKWYSAIFAIIIIFFAPQALRITGHFGMVYVHYIPMQFYWLFQYYKNRKFKYILYIGFMSLMMPFFHMYFAAFTLIWVGCYSIAYFLTQKKDNQKFLHLLPLIAIAILTLVLAFAFVKITDKITDRPVEPYGILNGCTKGKDIFTSQFSPIWQMILNIKPSKAEMIEGSCYVGISALIIALTVAFLWSKSIFKKITFALPFQTQVDMLWVYMAIFTLIFAMGVPFVWNMEFLYDLVPPMKQFRTLGRYSWSFYFIISLSASVFLYRYFEYLKSKSLTKARLIFFGAIFIWTLETSGNIYKIRNVIAEGPRFYKEIFATGTKSMSLNEFLKSNQLTKDSFQAMMFVPFTHIGSEKVWIEKDKIGAESMSVLSAYSLQTGLPFINQMMSRTSWGQTFTQIELVGGENNPFDQYCQYDFEGYNNKAILLITPKNYSQLPIYFGQHQLLNHSEGQLGYNFYKIYPNEIKSFCRNAIEHVQNSKWVQEHAEAIYADTLIGNQLDNKENNREIFHTKHWKSSLNISKVNKLFIDSFVVSQEQFLTTKEKSVEFSIWVNVPKSNYRSSKFKLYLFGKKGLDSIYDIDTKWSTQVIQTDSIWMRCGSIINIPSSTREVKILVENDRGKNGYSIQNLMVRPIENGDALTSCTSFFNQKIAKTSDFFINNRYVAKKRR